MLPTMHTVKALAVVVALASLTACSSSDSDPDTSATTQATASATTAAPAKVTPKLENTYVPTVGDPETHKLNITIRDKGRSYAPGTCVANQQPSSLGFSGPSPKYENGPLGDDFPLPKQGKSMADGSCEAKMAVTIPYAPRYTAGISIEGLGIADPKNPGPKQTNIVTKGDSQDVLVINYPS